jgi:cysteine desulfurase
MSSPGSFRSIYLDNNASAPPLPEVLEAVTCAMTRDFGNPSSAHSAGDRARVLIETARQEIAELVGARSYRITFTSSGTEANNLAISSGIVGAARARIITSQIEHSSVIKHCRYLESQGHDVVWVAVRSNGQVDLQDLENHLKISTDLVSVQWVNNETGVIQPVQEIAQLCKRYNARFHCDGAQAVGKLSIDLDCSEIDYVTFTAHKIHGPQGVGAVCANSSVAPLRPMMFGGEQEGGRRPGTENVAGIAGFGEAARIRRERLSAWQRSMQSLRDRFVHALCQALNDVVLNGADAPRVPNTANLQFDGIDGHALLARLDQRGIFCSQSSACTNRRPEPSYVLRAIGLSEDQAYASIRFSFSEQNSSDDIDLAIAAIVEEVTELRRFTGSAVFAA